MYKKKLYGMRFILPAFILYTVLYIIPTIAGMVISMTDWNVTRPDIQFIGLQNFVDIFTSKGGNYLASIGQKEYRPKQIPALQALVQQKRQA